MGYKEVRLSSYSELDGIDITNAQKGSLYLLLEAKDYDNLKHPSPKGTIEILPYGDSVTIQRMITLKGMFMRYKIGTVWSEWSKIGA